MADDSVADATSDSTVCPSLGAEAAGGFSTLLPSGRGIATAVRDALAGADAISRDGSCFGETGGGGLAAAADAASARGWLAGVVLLAGGITDSAGIGDDSAPSGFDGCGGATGPESA